MCRSPQTITAVVGPGGCGLKRSSWAGPLLAGLWHKHGMQNSVTKTEFREMSAGCTERGNCTQRQEVGQWTSPGGQSLWALNVQPAATYHCIQVIWSSHNMLLISTECLFDMTTPSQRQPVLGTEEATSAGLPRRRRGGTGEVSCVNPKTVSFHPLTSPRRSSTPKRHVCTHRGVWHPSPLPSLTGTLCHLTAPTLVQAAGVFSCLCITVNFMIASGIY